MAKQGYLIAAAGVFAAYELYQYYLASSVGTQYTPPATGGQPISPAGTSSPVSGAPAVPPASVPDSTRPPAAAAVVVNPPLSAAIALKQAMTVKTLYPAVTPSLSSGAIKSVSPALNTIVHAAAKAGAAKSSQPVKKEAQTVNDPSATGTPKLKKV